MQAAQTRVTQRVMSMWLKIHFHASFPDALLCNACASIFLPIRIRHEDSGLRDTIHAAAKQDRDFVREAALCRARIHAVQNKNDQWLPGKRLHSYLVV